MNILAGALSRNITIDRKRKKGVLGSPTLFLGIHMPNLSMSQWNIDNKDTSEVIIWLSLVSEYVESIADELASPDPILFASKFYY